MSKKSVKKIEQEFLWKPLPQKFQNVLMSSNFVIKGCDDGENNCLLKCLETAFQSDDMKIEKKYIHKLIVKNVKALKDDDFINIILKYRDSHKKGYKRYWDPRSIYEKKELANLVEEEVFFEGNDPDTLFLLSICLDIQFIVFDESFKSNTTLPSTSLDDKGSIIYLFYDSKKQKYNIIGFKYYKNNEIITKAIFHKNNLPEHIKFLTDSKAYLLESAKKIFFRALEDEETFSMDELIKRVEKDVKFNFDDKLRKELKETMTSWLKK